MQRVQLRESLGHRLLPHRHSYTERFHVLDGILTVEIGGRRLRLDPGGDATVPVGAVHAWSSGGPEPAVAALEIRPDQPGLQTILPVANG